jgi:hypothetical protein
VTDRFSKAIEQLGLHPAPRSFAAAAEAAIVRAVSDMAYFAARDAKCSDMCARMLQRCDVYLGIVGVRYRTVALGHALDELRAESVRARCGRGRSGVHWTGQPRPAWSGPTGPVRPRRAPRSSGPTESAARSPAGCA